ncbi:hypothetical protein K435DRAFT_800756 [Dendrothele bispora CBS 962.96]|uniref:Uncharacterized protein n=1 Tax=Dendrothele bispora (strain CBS 962.96) TaxID=1314807 RepID=A0A4S8LSQ7_DENBC|nr:hypothetical protein K435DRAFT_800756 [Dendrothele bispora CBS 962.96]
MSEPHLTSVISILDYDYRIWIVQTAISYLFYGFHLTMSLTTFYVFHKIHQKSTFSRAQKFMIIVTFIMLLMSTCNLVLSNIYLWIQFSNAFEGNNFPLFNKRGYTVVTINYFGGHYNPNSFGGVTGNGEGAEADIFLAVPFCFTNLLCTILVAYKAWSYRQTVNRILQSSSPISRVQKCLLFLMESGFLYSFCWILEQVDRACVWRTSTRGASVWPITSPLLVTFIITNLTTPSKNLLIGKDTGNDFV